MTTNITFSLTALAGEHGLDDPSVSRISWLDTLLREIDKTPGVKELLAGDDPDSMMTMLRECRALADDGMAAVKAAATSADAAVEGKRVHIRAEKLIVF